MTEQKRPNIKDYFSKNITPGMINNLFLCNVELYNYIQALDNYIDSLLSINTALLEACEAVMNEYYHDRLRLSGDVIKQLQSAINKANKRPESFTSNIIE